MSIFETKYRILPVYAKSSLKGFIVYFKLWWFPVWINAMLDEWVPAEEGDGGSVAINNRHAVFETLEEAKNFIRYRQTIVRKDDDGAIQSH